MTIAAPNYINDLHSQIKQNATPGQKFSLFLDIWTPNKNWEKNKEDSVKALSDVATMSNDCKEQITALIERQQQLSTNVPADEVYNTVFKSVAPLSTGMGIDHPLENGFAFLNPYGIPYLPGSSIKGVLRNAAKYLADTDSSSGWNDEIIGILFGVEATTVSNEGNEAALTERKGALDFWDCIPHLTKPLSIEVMAPHHTKYFQGTGSPNEAEKPVPIFYLSIPEKTIYSFTISANTRLLKDLKNWQELINDAMIFAGEWLGFGAKTALGYGILEQDKKQQQILEQENRAKAEEQAKQQEQAQEIAELTENRSELSAEFFTDVIKNNWDEPHTKDDFGRSLSSDSSWVARLEANDNKSEIKDAIEKIAEILRLHYGDAIIDDPMKTKGKKQKPIYSANQQDIGNRVAALLKEVG